MQDGAAEARGVFGCAQLAMLHHFGVEGVQCHRLIAHEKSVPGLTYLFLSLYFTVQMCIRDRLIAGLMFFGRAGTLTLIVALAQPRATAAVGYPEERILLG